MGCPLASLLSLTSSLSLSPSPFSSTLSSFPFLSPSPPLLSHSLPVCRTSLDHFISCPFLIISLFFSFFFESLLFFVVFQESAALLFFSSKNFNFSFSFFQLLSI